MRRTIMILAIAATAVVVCSGLAVAKTVNGGGGNDHLAGTGAKDTISGGGGDDDLFGKGAGDRLSGDSGNDGPDRVYGGTGSDDLYGNKGNDFHNAFDEQPNDTVRCGSGNRDVAIIDIITQSGNEDKLFGCELICLPICGCLEKRASQVDLAKLGPEDVKGAVEDGLLKRKAR